MYSPLHDISVLQKTSYCPKPQLLSTCATLVTSQIKRGKHTYTVKRLIITTKHDKLDCLTVDTVKFY